MTYSLTVFPLKIPSRKSTKFQITINSYLKWTAYSQAFLSRFSTQHIWQRSLTTSQRVIFSYRVCTFLSYFHPETLLRVSCLRDQYLKHYISCQQKRFMLTVNNVLEYPMKEESSWLKVLPLDIETFNVVF